MRRFFLNNELLGKSPEQVDALLDNRYPLLGAPKGSVWKNTVLFDCRDRIQTLKIIRLMGEGNAGLEALMSYADVSKQPAVKIRDKVRAKCVDWQKSQVFESEVQIDELLLRKKGLAGRKNQAVLVIAANDNSKCLYIPLPNQRQATIEKIILEHVSKSASIRTDGWVGYKGLSKLGYDHKASPKDKLPAAHAAIASWRGFLGKDRRPETNLTGKCAHASFVYSHRHVGKSRSDSLLDQCMLPGRPMIQTGTHVVRLTINPSKVERDMLFRRLAHQNLFLHLLQKWCRNELHNLVTSKKWKEATYTERVKLFDDTNFSRSELDLQATKILNTNPDVANYVDRATANSLVMETYTAFRKAAWGGHTLPRSKKRTVWNGNNQRQGLRLVDGFMIHSTAKMKDDHKLHIPLSWHSLGKERQAYYESRADCLRKISIKREWIRGKMKWFVLLSFECLPYRNQEYLDTLPDKGLVGLDVNKGCIGVAVNKGATTIDLSELALELTRKADRLRSERDKIKERNSDWEESKRYWRAHNRFSRSSRNARLMRDQAWRQVARSLRQAGKTVVTERDHIASWKRKKNVKDTVAQSVAPSRLKQLIKAEFQATGGTYTEVTAKTVKATATCPECGEVKGKDTSQRLHDCPCGCKLDRDTAAAINLARYGLGTKKKYPIRSRGVLLFGDAKASSPTGGQLLVGDDKSPTRSDTSAEKRLPSQNLDFNKFRE